MFLTIDQKTRFEIFGNIGYQCQLSVHECLIYWYRPEKYLLVDTYFQPLLGRTRSLGRYWTAIRLPHRPELSGHAVHEEVDGLDMEDNMVDGLFICATLTGRRGGHTSFVQAGAETSNIDVEAVKLDPGSSCKGHSRGWVLVSGMKMQSCGVVCPPHIPLVICPVCCTCRCCQMNWWDVVQQVQMGVSIWGTVYLHSMDGCALSGTNVQAPWHGVLGTVWLHCDEAQQVGCLWGLEDCPLV